MSVYKIVELVGTSPTSWEEAAKSVVDRANQSLRDLRVAEIVKLDMRLEDGRVVEYRARVALSFKFEGE
ncbi:MAG: dodecin domain-containing protein [Chloroflexi bacterium]|nr:dodecin domain-containing protein [Chloroflexota bacterium]MBK7178413.1 dodecin domain-containing protein [Chloroflexota bacterium]MBK7918737.1 dodecin domain-containing protein [Chloroflexota bacterium]MBK8933364.1 dodecin domain-containing protein [Chloroflexota bacterium]MBP6806274.1 dodecin domain-containing protein [Chloroflexota bacterium]